MVEKKGNERLMFNLKYNFFRKVLLLQLGFVIISCILSNYIKFISDNIGFIMGVIFLFPYEFIFNKDFQEYLKGSNEN